MKTIWVYVSKIMRNLVHAIEGSNVNTNRALDGAEYKNSGRVGNNLLDCQRVYVTVYINLTYSTRDQIAVIYTRHFEYNLFGILSVGFSWQ